MSDQLFYFVCFLLVIASLGDFYKRVQNEQRQRAIQRHSVEVEVD